MPWERTRYRLNQFWRGWRAIVSPADWALVQACLSQPAQRLFQRLPPDAQAHSLRVLRQLQAQADTPDALAEAALLHDVGKVAASDAGAYLGLWVRGPLVLLEALWPALVARLAASQPSSSLRYALYVHREHPQIGAIFAREAGCRELTCWLIEHHQDKELTGDAVANSLLARLQWADGRS